MKRNGGNGTSIHWHGLRQWNTMHMNGVNGLSQCPIAPDDSFNYTFDVMKFGSSWYHSHYSVQHADGLVGPLVRPAHQSSSFLALYYTSTSGLSRENHAESAYNRLFTDLLTHHMMKRKIQF